MPDSSRPDRAEAQRHVDRIRAFRAELEQLISNGVVSLTEEQRRAIETHHDVVLRQLAAAHDVDRSDAAGQLSRGMRIASFFAALALTAAIYSLVARFWGRLELPMQATLLCALPLMALVGVELAAQRERTLYFSSIFAIAAFGCYWLAVFELSALLNIPVTPPAIWGGALFGVALALPYRFRLIFGGGLAAFLLALAGTAFQAAGIPWSAVVEYPEIITVAALVLALISPQLRSIDPSFAAVTRLVGLGTAFMGLLMLSTAGRVSLLPTPTRVSEFIYQSVMLLLCMVTLFIAIRKQWGETVYLAAGVLTVFLFARFVDWFWGVVPQYLFFLLLAAIAFGWLFALRRLRQRLTRTEAA